MLIEMTNKTKPIDFTPQQITLARELVKRMGEGDLKANVEFHNRFNEAQRIDLFTNHIKLPKLSQTKFKEEMAKIIREEDQKVS